MKIRFWGVRGSLPSPGPKTVRYGGNSVCVEVRLPDGTIILLDAGTGAREFGKALMAEGVAAQLHCLFTHVHWDHIIGWPFAAPLYSPKMEIFQYPLATEAQEQGRRDRTLFKAPFFPVPGDLLPAKIIPPTDSGNDWKIGSARVRAIPLNHPGGAQGYRIDNAGASLALLTDNELGTGLPSADAFTDSLAERVRGVDVLIHDAQYVDADLPLKRGWGHSTVREVLELARRARTPHVVLFHHDPERDDAALDAIGHEANAWLRDHAPGTRATVAWEGLVIDLPEK